MNGLSTLDELRVVKAKVTGQKVKSVKVTQAVNHTTTVNAMHGRVEEDLVDMDGPENQSRKDVDMLSEKMIPRRWVRNTDT